MSTREAIGLVLTDALRGVALKTGLPAGRILLLVGPLEDAPILIELSPAGCDVREERGDADLTLYTDDEQLEELLTSGQSARSLTTHGRVELLRSLAAMLGPGESPLSTRIAMMKRR